MNTQLAEAPSLELIADALRAIPTEPGYAEWVKVLMAVHSAYPGPEGVQLVEAWSPGHEGEVSQKFKSFGQGTKVGVGTLFYMAQQNGWVQPQVLPALAQPQRAPARAKPQRKQAQGWQRAEAERSLAQAQERLFAPAGEPGQQYLLSRALESHAWLTFGLGFDPAVALPGTGGKQRAPAIVLPWYRAGKLVAVRYRFLEAHTYTDIEGKERESVKLSSAAGCSFSGVLFGGQALLGVAQRLRTLVLCEGELNALSLWLVGHDTELDVLSTGSENHRITPAMVQALGQYRRVIVWADRPDITTSAMQLLPGAYGISSPGGQDANDLLQQGLLGGVLSAARAKACTSEHELEGLLWALWDAANRVQGVDTGTAKMIEWLASELGKQVILHEPEPGRWITKR